MFRRIVALVGILGLFGLVAVRPAKADISASNYLTYVTPGTCGGSSCLVNLVGKVTKVPGYSWMLYGIINYRTPAGTWAYCGPTRLDTLQIDGGYVHYNGQSAPLFAPGHTYYFETVLQLVNSQGQVVLTAYSNQVACTIPGS